MEMEALNTESFLMADSMSLDSLNHSFEIPALIVRMKQCSSWINGELNSIVLLRSPGKAIVLTALHERTEIVSVQSNDPVTIQVIEGRLILENHKESFTLTEHQLLTISDRMKFRLTSMEETVFLLTILKGSCCLSGIESGVN
jgi:hypothetical protein